MTLTQRVANGAESRIRTDDLLFTKQLLWPAELSRHVIVKSGAPSRIRTHDLTLRRRLLYPLSYRGVKSMGSLIGLEPMTCEVGARRSIL